MSSSQGSARTSTPPDEQDDDEVVDDDVAVQPLSPRERAEKAAAAAQARASGQPAATTSTSISTSQQHVQPEVSTASIVQPSQEETAEVAQSIQNSTGVQVDQATAALAAATLSTHPDIKEDLAKSLAEQLECCKYHRIATIICLLTVPLPFAAICRETVYQPVSGGILQAYRCGF